MDNEKKAINNAFDQTGVIPVLEEQFSVEKKTIENARITVSKKVNEAVESVDIPLASEEVSVNRVEINQYIDTAPPAVRHEGEKTIIPVLKEVLVVEKKLMLVEEIHITRKQVKTTATHQEMLKKEDVIINRVNTTQQ